MHIRGQNPAMRSLIERLIVLVLAYPLDCNLSNELPKDPRLWESSQILYATKLKVISGHVCPAYNETLPNENYTDNLRKQRSFVDELAVIHWNLHQAIGFD